MITSDTPINGTEELNDIEKLTPSPEEAQAVFNAMISQFDNAIHKALQDARAIPTVMCIGIMEHHIFQQHSSLAQAHFMHQQHVAEMQKAQAEAATGEANNASTR